MTQADLIARREAAMDAADRALNAAWPDRNGPKYVNTIQAAAAQLQKISHEMEAAGVPQVEPSRAHRDRGRVLSDLVTALGKGMLGAARDGYRMAEALLAGCADPVEHAKLDFNLANAPRQMDAANVDQLSQAERRLVSARAVFERSAPWYLPRIDEALASTRALLSPRL